jgi:hypothetical protein
MTPICLLPISTRALPRRLRWLPVGLVTPGPPLLFGLHTLSQATRPISFYFLLPLHRKSLWMALIFCSIPLGAGNTDIIYVGIACRTVLVRISLPARFRALYVQFFTLSCSLLITPSHVAFLQALSVRGIPKYFVGSVLRSNPRMLAKFL